MALFKRMAALLLCAALILSAAAGCARKKSADAPENTENTEPAGEETRTEVYAKAYEAYAPDELMLTVGGKRVEWQEFYYWLLVSIEYFIENYGEIEDWSAGDGNITVKEYVLKETVDIIRLHRAVENKAAELGVTVSGEDAAYLDSTKAGIIEQYGGREEFEASLKESFMSEELYDGANETSVLYFNTFEKLFGENGGSISDAEVLEFAGSIGYLRMKHIMFAKLDENGEALGAETVAEKLKAAESALDEILAAPLNEREELFDAKMHEVSEDPDLEQYPDGYSFVSGSGEMAEELDAAAAALGAGEVCGQIVETEQGFHIVMRLAVEPDAMVDEYYTLRYYAAYNKFEDMAVEWQNSTPVEQTDAYNGLNFDELFPGL